MDLMVKYPNCRVEKKINQTFIDFIANKWQKKFDEVLKDCALGERILFKSAIYIKNVLKQNENTF